MKRISLNHKLPMIDRELPCDDIYAFHAMEIMNQNHIRPPFYLQVRPFIDNINVFARIERILNYKNSHLNSLSKNPATF